ncbi:uncharacterized protein LOC118479658 [Helianthus annuus]|uniref:uncharacterized protein LOC118479658 n=1 Tax=Helianthus annuus TaxID=4232 RepID=UPI0016532B69|nr:uncharacterized protein LOC118479658 [Helianthus annuus]
MVCKFSTVRASDCEQRVYAESSQDLEGSLIVSGSAAESHASIESAFEANSATATASDETNYESMAFVNEGCRSERYTAAPSGNHITRKFHGRKSVPHRSPLF